VSDRRAGPIVLIGVFKLTKAAVLIAVAVADLVAGPQRLAGLANHVLTFMGALPGRETLQQLVGKLWSLDLGRSEWLAGAALAYAAVFLVEGVGLVLRKTWAEWLTVVVTSSFIPLEIYELVAHFGPGKVVALVLNVAIVAYLLWVRLRGQVKIGSGQRVHIAGG
jgi:uncharacterized membrane protein (DUF2068 family)